MNYLYKPVPVNMNRFGVEGRRTSAYTYFLRVVVDDLSLLGISSFFVAAFLATGFCVTAAAALLGAGFRGAAAACLGTGFFRSGFGRFRTWSLISSITLLN